MTSSFASFAPIILQTRRCSLLVKLSLAFWVFESWLFAIRCGCVVLLRGCPCASAQGRNTRDCVWEDERGCSTRDCGTTRGGAMPGVVERLGNARRDK